MLVVLLIPVLLNTVPAFKQVVYSALDSTIGVLLRWNISVGMLITLVILSIIMILVQKYGTDQESLKEIRKEQKAMQEEMKKYRNDPQKLLEFNKKQMEMIPKTMRITMRSTIYTIIPFILLFQWFRDYFSTVEFRFFGFLSWFWFYFIFMIIFSSVFRKVFKVA